MEDPGKRRKLCVCFSPPGEAASVLFAPNPKPWSVLLGWGSSPSESMLVVLILLSSLLSAAFPHGCCSCRVMGSHHTWLQVVLKQEETMQQYNGFVILGRRLANDIVIKAHGLSSHTSVKSYQQQAVAECGKRSPYE